MKRFVSSDQARPAKRQHKSPCGDCPFARTAVRGWLGLTSVEEWLQAVHGEALVDCHTIMNMQCAGTAIYRANVCKVPRDPSILQLPPNKKLVFSWPDEFRQHHSNFEKAPSARTTKPIPND